jgi:hypothetical protein
MYDNWYLAKMSSTSKRTVIAGGLGNYTRANFYELSPDELRREID